MELDGLPSTIMPRPVVTYIFDLLTQKPTQYVYWPRYKYDRILAKLAAMVTKI